MNPLDEFLDEYVPATKEAGWKDVAAHGGNALAQGLGAGVGAAVLAGGTLAVQHLYDAATSKRDFRGMMDLHQDLHYEDQRSVLQAFKTLRNFAPDMSRDPLVAGSMVRQMVASPNGVAGHVHTALDAQRSMGTPVTNSVLLAGAKATGEGMKHVRPFDPPGELHRDLQERDEDYARQQNYFDKRISDLQQGHAAQTMSSAQRAFDRGVAEGRRNLPRQPGDPGAQMVLPGIHPEFFKRRPQR